MTPERWNRIKELFSEALPLSEDDRQRFLSRAAGGDDELIREVQSLLSAAAKPGDEAHPTAGLFAPDPGGPQPFIGTRIGPFTVLREVARGGMGIVLEGTRAGDFQQRVAIKVIRAASGGEEIVRRFRSERAVLSSLQHPNIATFLDGGTLPDGTPFLVMEFIEGEPIDAYCDRHCLPVSRRLELFGAVCAAVEYAHQNLVVHRDLKPGNILVTAHGVKLLDFGIAKLLTVESTHDALASTREGSHFLTPEYASPEQILGRNVTTASDTYSLGVLLYKLLTGERPYRFKTPTLRDVEHAIVEGQPTKPSSSVLTAAEGAAEARGTSRLHLARLLSGDLDTIVLKALQKDPARRYSSVEDFHRDIRRFLAGLPVSARPDSALYRASKFVRRNTVAVAAAALVILSLAGGAVVSIVQAQRAERERDRAQAEAEKAKQVVSVLKEIFSSADRSRATKADVTVAEVLEHASRRIEKDLASRPEIAADVLSTVASTYEGLGLYDKAKATMATALRLQEVSHGGEHPDVAEALHGLGMIHHMSEERAAAESLYNRSLAIFRRDGRPSNEHATTLNDYAVFVQDQGLYPLADSLLRAALDMYEALPADNRRQRASSLHNLALNFDWLGQLSIADSLYRESLRLQREVYGGQNAQMASTIGNMGFIAEARGDYAGAESLYRESLAIRRAMLGEGHNVVAGNKIKLGLFLLDHGSGYEEPERLCRQALAALMATNPELKRLVARAHLGIGRALERRGQTRAAERELREAIASFLLAQPMNAAHVADAEIFLSDNLIAQKRFREAEAQLLLTRRRLQAASADSSEEMRRATGTLGRLYEVWKRPG